MIPEVMEIIVRVLSKERDHAREIVEAIIDSEQNYLFTNDNDYKDNNSDIVTEEQHRGGLDPQYPGDGSGPGGPGGHPQQQ